MTLRTSFIKHRENHNKKRYYKALVYPELFPSLDDIYIITTVGDRLDLLASQFYHDVDLWWIIAIANPDVARRDSFNLKGGLQIRIPINTDEIIEQFRKLNE